MSLEKKDIMQDLQIILPIYTQACIHMQKISLSHERRIYEDQMLELSLCLILEKHCLLILR